MADTPRKKTLEELRSEAIAKFGRRGYDVRGKTPAQIRQMLRNGIRKQKLNTDSVETLVKSGDYTNFVIESHYYTFKT